MASLLFAGVSCLSEVITWDSLSFGISLGVKELVKQTFCCGSSALVEDEPAVPGITEDELVCMVDDGTCVDDGTSVDVDVSGCDVSIDMTACDIDVTGCNVDVTGCDVDIDVAACDVDVNACDVDVMVGDAVVDGDDDVEHFRHADDGDSFSLLVETSFDLVDDPSDESTLPLTPDMDLDLSVTAPEFDVVDVTIDQVEEVSPPVIPPRVLFPASTDPEVRISRVSGRRIRKPLRYRD